MKKLRAQPGQSAIPTATRHPILKCIRAQPRNRIRELLRSFVTFDLPDNIKERARTSD